MLFVVSKEKIISYVIAFSTVLILLGIAMLSVDMVPASASIYQENTTMNENDVQYQE